MKVITRGRRPQLRGKKVIVTTGNPCLCGDCGGSTPSTPGACCHTDGSCDIQTSAGCASSGGAYQGDGTTCVDVDCTNCPQVSLSWASGAGNVPTCGGTDCLTSARLLAWSQSDGEITTKCRFHADGTFNIVCTTTPPPSSTTCTGTGSWSFDYYLDTSTGIYTVVFTVNAPGCGTCCGVSHTQTETGVYISGGDDFFNSTYGNFCGLGDQLNTSVEVAFA